MGHGPTLLALLFALPLILLQRPSLLFSFVPALCLALPTEKKEKKRINKQTNKQTKAPTFRLLLFM
jgi:hypothetical protein